MEKALVLGITLTFRGKIDWLIDWLVFNTNFSSISAISGNLEVRSLLINEIKDTTHSYRSALYLTYINLDINLEEYLHWKIFDKHDDLDFTIVNLPILRCSIHASPASEKLSNITHRYKLK
jgi:serine kinase of HPr protein (carbohydrate metabolism regulator)